MDGKMSFSEALQELKAGSLVSRSGWNGNGMFLFLNPGSEIKVSEGRPLAVAYPIGVEVACLPYIMLKVVGVRPTLVPWLASQSDILAEDWFVLRRKE